MGEYSQEVERKDTVAEPQKNDESTNCSILTA